MYVVEKILANQTFYKDYCLKHINNSSSSIPKLPNLKMDKDPNKWFSKENTKYPSVYKKNAHYHQPPGKC
jgi:hypothetical protein